MLKRPWRWVDGTAVGEAKRRPSHREQIHNNQRSEVMQTKGFTVDDEDFLSVIKRSGESARIVEVAPSQTTCRPMLRKTKVSNRGPFAQKCTILRSRSMP